MKKEVPELFPIYIVNLNNNQPEVPALLSHAFPHQKRKSPGQNGIERHGDGLDISSYKHTADLIVASFYAQPDLFCCAFLGLHFILFPFSHFVSEVEDV